MTAIPFHPVTKAKLFLTDGDVDDIADLEQERVHALVGSEEGVDVEAEALGDEEEGVAGDDGVGGRAALDAGIAALLGQARGVVRGADVGRDLEDLAEREEVGVGDAARVGDVADAGAESLRDDGQGVARDDGVVNDRAGGACRRGDDRNRGRGRRAGGSGRGGGSLL